MLRWRTAVAVPFMKFDIIFRAVYDRLLYFDTSDACGQSNATLIDDFRSDLKFIRAADDLFCEAVARHTGGECIASDGLSLETVMTLIGTSMSPCFRLNFLDSPFGYGQAPARFLVAIDPADRDRKLATICCGLRQPDGDFWYPSTKRVGNVVMPDDYEWAYSQTRCYGQPTVSSWLARRPRNRGE